MSTIFSRSALIFWGHNPGPDVASVVIDYPGAERRVVTWADVMAERRKEQARRLDCKRRVVRSRPHRLWVAYFDQDLMGGWHAFVDDFRGRVGQRWIRRGDGEWGWPTELRRLFPAGADGRSWDEWLPRFARIYQRGWHHGKPRGSAFFWWDGHGDMRPAEPAGR